MVICCRQHNTFDITTEELMLVRKQVSGNTSFAVTEDAEMHVMWRLRSQSIGTFEVLFKIQDLEL